LVLIIGSGLALAGVSLWAEYHYRAAEEALKDNRLKDARDHVDKCLQVWPHSAVTNLLAARAARRSGRFAEARRYLRVCEEQGVDSADLDLERYMMRAQTGDVDGVGDYLHERVEEGHPQTPQIFEALVWGCLANYRLAQAEFLLGQWFKHQSDNSQAFFLRGWLKELGSNYQSAAADFRQVVARNPENDEARLHLANTLLEIYKAREALPHLKQLRRRSSTDPTVLVPLARAYLQLARPDESRQILDQLLEHQPRYAAALVARGKLELEMRHPARAEPFFRRAIKEDPSDFGAHYGLYQCLQKQEGKEAQARKQRARWKRLDADMKRIHAIIMKQLARSPRDPTLHKELGVLYLRTGERNKGLHWLNSALEIDPHYREAHAALADFYRREGNTELEARHRAQLRR
jgi:tetratricopeptide (TPR) repeat protein